MATAIALGSMLASGASATAAAVGAKALTIGSVVGAMGPVQPLFSIGAATLGQIGSGLGIAGQFLSMQQQSAQADVAYQAQLAASRAELDAARTRASESSLAAQRERTQAAIEEAERQRRLRRTLAAQRAAFAGSGIDPYTGSPVAIQEQTAGQINRESRLAELTSADRISSINRQRLGHLGLGKSRAVSLLSSAAAGQEEAGIKKQQQLQKIGTNIGKLAETF